MGRGERGMTGDDGQGRVMINLRLPVVAGVFLALSLSAARGASIVTEWLDQAVPDVQDVASEPTVGSRFLAIFFTAIYDAWTAYDPTAIGVVSGAALKGEGGPANEANKREAISHAAYTVLRILVPQRRRALFERMVDLGYEPAATTKPAEIGRRAAAAVLARFRDDGANAVGDFADTTGFRPGQPATPSSWQPIDVLGYRQLPITPQWSRVMPFALTRADQFHQPPPPAPGSAEWRQQIDILIKTSASLTDTQKAAAEYWGIWGMSPAPQLIEITKFVSDTNDLRIDDDVKLFLVASNAIFDASIAAWEAKYTYDYIRPITAIRQLGDTPIMAWRPRSLPAMLASSSPAAEKAAYGLVPVPAEVAEMRAADWEPYLPTPAFPSYVSGHSAFTAAWARSMELAMGRPDLNFDVTVARLYVEHRELARPVRLFFPTFASAAEASGISRIWAGIHWPDDNQHGLELGRFVGENAWRHAQQLFLGTASPATAALITLRPPFWFHDSASPDHPARFETGSGLVIDMGPGSAGRWQSTVLDPIPAGNYELKLKLAATGDAPVSLRTTIEPGEPGNRPFASTEAPVPATGTSTVITVPWASDGTRSFQVTIEARSDNGSARLLVSAIAMPRVWPIVAGSPRYYEPSLVGLQSQ
jgi:membrane-associated phospholipid phosphatase